VYKYCYNEFAKTSTNIIFEGMSESAAHIDYKGLYEATLLLNQQLLKSMEQQQKSNQHLQDQVSQLQYQLQQLTKLLKGFKSERFVPAATSNMQPELAFSLEVVAPATNLSEVSKISYTRTKKANKDPEQESTTKLPDHLRRETTILDPIEDVSDCVKIGEEVRETLSWIPGEIFVNRTVVNIYSRPAGKKGKEIIVRSALPARAINKCLADPALLAHITVDKLVDHKPLNRQLEAFNRNGVTIAYSTIADWICLVAKALQPLGAILLKEMYKYDYWHADETTIAVLDKAKKKETHKGYYWSV
jgi:transposase